MAEWIDCSGYSEMFYVRGMDWKLLQDGDGGLVSERANLPKLSDRPLVAGDLWPCADFDDSSCNGN